MLNHESTLAEVITDLRRNSMLLNMKLLFTSIILTPASTAHSINKDLAETPPMGWNSWNKFGCNVSEKLIKEIADAMVETGLKEAGYQMLLSTTAGRSIEMNRE